MIDGQRIGTADDLDGTNGRPGCRHPKTYRIQTVAITGCVYLKKQGDKIYLGTLTVSPLLQAQGIGRKLLAAAEAYAPRSIGIHTIM
jgi:GNAT superfamily N-acetyltransferase